MKKTITIFTIFILSLLSIQSINAQVKTLTVTGYCLHGVLYLNSKASLISNNNTYLWGIYKNEQLIKIMAGTRNMTAWVNITTHGSANYSLRVQYMFTDKTITEYGNSIIPTTSLSSITFSNIIDQTKTFCASKDSAVILSFSNIWDNATINVYSTTSFNGPQGALLNTMTINNPAGEYEIYNTIATGLMSVNSYILVTVTANDYCTIGSRTLYFYKSGSCRTGEFEATSIDTKTADKLIVYPNPADDVIKINGNSFDVKKIELYSSQGLLIETISDMSKTEFDLSALTSGLYFVKMHKYDGSTIIEKITKK